MKVTDGRLPGVKLIEPDVYGDQRGFFMETWNLDRYRDIGITSTMTQANASRSARGVLRGLHFQTPNPQGKLVYVMEGEVFDVAVDIRRGSPTFGQWEGVTLSAENKRQFYVPAGYAHGFCVTSEHALFCYLCTTIYDAEADAGVAWNDPDIGIDWPIASPSLSGKDQNAPTLRDFPVERLPTL